MRPLDLPALDRLVVLRDDIPGLNLRNIETVAPIVEEYEKHPELFDAAGGYLKSGFALTGFGDAARIAGVQTVGSFFNVFGVQPALGRLYDPAEEAVGRNQVVVLSYSFWQRVYGGDRKVLGREIELEGKLYRIVGVLPASFQYPREKEVYVPLPADSRMRGANALTAVARLRSGLTMERARAQVAANSTGMAKTFGLNPEWHYSQLVVPFVEFEAGKLRSVLLILMGAVGFVLLIACANLAGLQLARAAVRAREFGLRVALGASRWAIVRLALVESIMMAVAGSFLGLILGSFLLDALARWHPAGMTALEHLSMSPTVLAFSGAVALAVGFGFGIVPAFRASRADPQTALREGGRTGSGGVRRHRALETLAAVQIGLALVLLVASGLLVRSLGNLLRADPGFRPEQVTSLVVSLPRGRYTASKAMLSFTAAVENGLRQIPGAAFGIVSELPFSGAFNSSPFEIPGRPDRPGEPARHANLRIADSAYFAALGIPVVKGRLFNEGDTREAPLVALIDGQLARQYFPGEDPVGKRINQETPAVIVGVVGSVSHEELGEPAKATVYYAASQSALQSFFVVARSSMPAPSVAALVRRTLDGLDKSVPISDVKSMPQRIEGSLATRRLAEYIMAGFAFLAVALALIGTYGVLSYSISQRTHEIGIRLALGAEPRGIVAMVLGRGMTLAAAGLLCGGLGALWLGRFLSSLLYGIDARDPLTLLGGAGLLAAATLAACYLPARRAATVDPGVTLRSE
jgi:putative ABC transport system permease protein